MHTPPLAAKLGGAAQMSPRQVEILLSLLFSGAGGYVVTPPPASTAATAFGSQAVRQAGSRVGSQASSQTDSRSHSISGRMPVEQVRPGLLQEHGEASAGTSGGGHRSRGGAQNQERRSSGAITQQQQQQQQPEREGLSGLSSWLHENESASGGAHTCLQCRRSLMHEGEPPLHTSNAPEPIPTHLTSLVSIRNHCTVQQDGFIAHFCRTIQCYQDAAPYTMQFA